MTIKEKAIAYDKALEIARQYWNNRAMPIGTNFKLERMFPELREPEDTDEKVRKALIKLVTNHASMDLFIEYDIHLDEALAWLEKKGEQKPIVIIPKFRVGDEIKTSNEESLTITKIDEKGYWSEDLFICGFDEECIWDLVGQKHADKIEPKFKVGDWITDNNSTFQIVKVENEWYYADDGDKICFDVAHQYYHLWTIQDAKDGDVLCTYECGTPKIVFVLKGTPKKHYALSYYCYYNIMYPHFNSDSEKGCLAPNDEDVKPATKEQSDALMKAMADARYTFDFEKKELKMIEQNNAKWSKEDEGYFKSIAHALSVLLVDPYFDEIKLEHFGWFQSLKDRYAWKPSEEQIETLKCACGGNYVDLGILESLYKDLKKLREE